MKKILKFSILLSLVFLLTSVNAFSINMNLENSSPANTTNIVEETLNQDDLSEREALNSNINNEETDNSFSRVTTTNSDEDEFLTVENILSIIIIVIGILLIFLAIAILIRLK